MPTAAISVFILLGCCIGALVVWKLGLLSPTIRLPYPPGPPIKGLLSGNASDIPTEFAWLTYTQWGKKHGDLIHFRAFNQHIIVLNSIEDATELFEKRASLYSSRPLIPMWDMMGMGYSTTVKDYSPEWKKHRRLFQQILRHDAAVAYRPMQTDKIHDMLYALVTTPDEFASHLQKAAGAIVMSVMYGYDVIPKNDPFIELVESTIDGFERGMDMTWMVNRLPILRHIPAWFIGAGFKRYAASVRKLVIDQVGIPFKYTQEKLASGSSRLSVVSSLLKNCHSDYDLRILREVVGTSYGAGVSTTSYTILVFIIAMITHPEIQRKAQREVDSVTCGDRLTEFDDQSAMPYLEAIYREVLRWRPIVPLGIPHSNNIDDIYKGYYIPKDTIILSNIWAMSRDPEKYPDPETFCPERYLDENGNLADQDVDFVFGFGRRICPGRHLASASVWLAMATILQTFDLSNKEDSFGNPIPLDIKDSDGVVNHPLPFECSIKPRSDRAKQRILETCRKQGDNG